MGKLAACQGALRGAMWPREDTDQDPEAEERKREGWTGEERKGVIGNSSFSAVGFSPLPVFVGLVSKTMGAILSMSIQKLSSMCSMVGIGLY